MCQLIHLGLKEKEEQRKQEEQRMLDYQQQTLKKQEEALATIVASSRKPVAIGPSGLASTPVMRTNQKQASSRSTVASLRINRTPGANINMGGSGTNIG